jgi:hypothetical protein
VLSESDSVGRLQLGCAPKHGAFEAVYGNGPPTVEISDEEGAVLFFLLRLFNSLQAIGSPMAIDLREYSRVLEDHEVTGLGAVS